MIIRSTRLQAVLSRRSSATTLARLARPPTRTSATHALQTDLPRSPTCTKTSVLRSAHQAMRITAATSASPALLTVLPAPHRTTQPASRATPQPHLRSSTTQSVMRLVLMAPIRTSTSAWIAHFHAVTATAPLFALPAHSRHPTLLSTSTTADVLPHARTGQPASLDFATTALHLARPVPSRPPPASVAQVPSSFTAVHAWIPAQTVQFLKIPSARIATQHAPRAQDRQHRALHVQRGFTFLMEPAVLVLLVMWAILLQIRA